MSNTPYYSPNTRTGARYGDVTLVDGVAKDGLSDAYSGKAMGFAAEECAEEHKVTRADQDEYAIKSYKKAQKAAAEGLFKDEIFPIEVSGGRGKPNKIVDVDDEHKNVRSPLSPLGTTS